MQSTRKRKMLFDNLADEQDFKQQYFRQALRYAKFQYECSNYSGTARYLYIFLEFVSVIDRNVLSSL